MYGQKKIISDQIKVEEEEDEFSYEDDEFDDGKTHKTVSSINSSVKSDRFKSTLPNIHLEKDFLSDSTESEEEILKSRSSKENSAVGIQILYSPKKKENYEKAFDADQNSSEINDSDGDESDSKSFYSVQLKKKRTKRKKKIRWIKSSDSDYSDDIKEIQKPFPGEYKPKSIYSPQSSKHALHKKSTRSSINTSASIASLITDSETDSNELRQMENERQADLVKKHNNQRQETNNFTIPSREQLEAECRALKLKKASIHLDEYDPKMFVNMNVSGEIKNLFQYITKYSPEYTYLNNFFKPFFPSYYPAVGDVDAFLKVIPPPNLKSMEKDFNATNNGLVILDEPAIEQSDTALLHLQLRMSMSGSFSSKSLVIKKVEHGEANKKCIDKWIKDMSDLHLSKPSSIFKYSNSMPSMETLKKQWPEKFASLMQSRGIPSNEIDCTLTEYIQIICALIGIPIYPGKIIESLHLLFTFYLHAIQKENDNKTLNTSNDSENKVDIKTIPIFDTKIDQLILDY